MRMMQMVADTIVRMIAVRHRLVAAIRAVNMSGVVTAAAVTGGAAVRVLGRNLDHMLIHVIIMGVMQMTLMEIVDVPLMAHCLVTAAGAVSMRMAGMLVGRTAGHQFISFLFPRSFAIVEARYWPRTANWPSGPSETPGSCRSEPPKGRFSPPG